MAGKKYSDKVKQEVLEYLRKNNHYYLRTAKHFNISPNTIKAWDDYPNNVPEEAKQRILNNTACQKKSLIVKNREMLMLKEELNQIPDSVPGLVQLAKKSILKKLVILIPTIDNAKELLYLVQTLVNIDKLEIQSKPVEGSAKTAFERMMGQLGSN